MDVSCHYYSLVLSLTVTEIILRFKSECLNCTGAGRFVKKIVCYSKLLKSNKIIYAIIKVLFNTNQHVLCFRTKYLNMIKVSKYCLAASGEKKKEK